MQFAAISAPETVMGASLLSFFVQLGVGRGYWTIVIAHIMFSLSFVGDHRTVAGAHPRPVDRRGGA